ncbi:hypothetical protein HELRODRAFT_87041 [Helobdella robusta]|uniref:C-mannosyltransferase DPY19L3 n=1 Tax=Helobdella robusta TaxID=6412 RepID=T1G6K8_HELRO|nr:hypothetical protein HELRODRAFT_87041 [Helobdella robusta]ESN95211.1 hypothetical protein HELRODRAFT_87041 [Helobdella robusta]
MKNDRTNKEPTTWSICNYFWEIIGSLVCLLCGIIYVYIVRNIHEARMFFTGITEVEREISFRTENGLYYSYYKQLIQSPSLLQGVYDLTHDRLTEHPQAINVLARMNVYQEVVLAAIYRNVPFISSYMEPVFFYIYVVFFLHGLMICSLFVMTWVLSGTWLAGVLTFLFYLINSADVTRVETYMPLRENFSLPCLWMQLLAITLYFQSDSSPKLKNFYEKTISITTFLFALMWQFNQFALLLQCMALFGCQVLHVVNKKKILHVYISIFISMLVVSFLQFFNTMILSGFLLSFILAAFTIMYFQSTVQTTCRWFFKLFWMVFNVIAVFVVASFINALTKLIFQQESDEHINRFVLAKFGFSSLVDFDVRLYLCNGGFTFLSWDYAERLLVNMVLPQYILVHLVLLILLLITSINILFSAKTENIDSLIETSKTGDSNFSFSNYILKPEYSYHSIQMVFFGAVSIIAMRMKYFWTPYICVFASVCLFKHQPWALLVKKIFSNQKDAGRKLIPLEKCLLNCFKNVREEINNLREFYDPDTVELMHWIKSTNPGDSFSGSMQLMAAVKLSTGRPITNHPHYEDKGLRLKTKDIYKYYGRYSADEVHETLKKYQTNYIIMEDSICLVPLRDGCGLPYIMDMENGWELEQTSLKLVYKLNDTNIHPRFCEKVRYQEESYKMFFKLVFENKTFKIYLVL